MICGVCGIRKQRLLKEKAQGYFIFVDEIGAKWYGIRCPDCYKAEKEKYNKRILRHSEPLAPNK